MYRFLFLTLLVAVGPFSLVVPVSAQTAAIKHAVCSVVGEHSAGEKSADVTAIQSFLASRGFVTPETGEFNTATVAALKQFQTTYAADTVIIQGLTSASGVWDIYTAMKARELVCGASVVPVSSVPVSQQPAVTTPVQVGVIAQDGALIPVRSAFTPSAGTVVAVVAPSVAPAVPSTVEPLVCLALELEPGIKNSDEVRTMQKWLLAQGYTKVEVTGYFGPMTKRAVAHFQKEYAAEILVPAGLTKATGVWGERTAKKASRMGLCDFDTDVSERTEDDENASGSTGAVIPERDAFQAASTSSSVQTQPNVTQSQALVPQSSATSVSSVATSADSSRDVAATDRLEDVYPGVCLPKTIGPIGTVDAKGNVVSDVKMMQRFLRSRGYTKVEVTGVYGPTTQRAISHFQTENARDILEPAGLTNATGVWGLRTAIKASELDLCSHK